MILIDLILALVAGFLTLYVLRSMARTMNDGLRVAIAVLVGIVVFFEHLSHYIVTH